MMREVFVNLSVLVTALARPCGICRATGLSLDMLLNHSLLAAIHAFKDKGSGLLHANRGVPLYHLHQTCQ
jgi:hypothetical protein